MVKAGYRVQGSSRLALSPWHWDPQCLPLWHWGPPISFSLALGSSSLFFHGTVVSQFLPLWHWGPPASSSLVLGSPKLCLPGTRVLQSLPSWHWGPPGSVTLALGSPTCVLGLECGSVCYAPSTLQLSHSPGSSDGFFPEVND